MTVPRRLAPVAALGLLLAGCGAGQNAETANVVPAIPGVDATAGPVQLLDLLIPFKADGYPAGSDAPLVVRMVSTADGPVELTAVTPGPAGVNLVVPGRVALHPATPGLPIRIAPHDCRTLVPPTGSYLVAGDLSAALTYGYQVPMRFTFSGGAAVDVNVPMAPPDYSEGTPLGPSAAPALCANSNN